MLITLCSSVLILSFKYSILLVHLSYGDGNGGDGSGGDVGGDKQLDSSHLKII